MSPTAHTTPTSRYATRLAALPPDVLLSLAAMACENLPHEAIRAAADASLAVHSPFPQWAHDEVILSTDLLPHLLGWIEPDRRIFL